MADWWGWVGLAMVVLVGVVMVASGEGGVVTRVQLREVWHICAGWKQVLSWHVLIALDLLCHVLSALLHFSLPLPAHSRCFSYSL